VFNYVKSGGQSESEPIEGRICDCINYLLLFSKQVAEKKRTTAPPSPKTFVARYVGATCHKCKLAVSEINSEHLCLVCFSDVGTCTEECKKSDVYHCAECKKPTVVNAAGYCHDCVMKADPKWLRANVDKP